MKFLSFFVFFFALSLNAVAQSAPDGFDLSSYSVKIEPERRVMVVLGALDSARNDSGKRLLNTTLSAAGTKFRDQMESELAVPDDLRQRISTFVAAYKKRHPQATDAEIISPFISMAYSLSQVPNLADPAVTSDLPGSLLDVLDFAPLVREYYRRSGIAAKLDQYVKDYQAKSDTSVRPSARDMVSELLDYLHTRPQTLYTEKVKVEAQKGNSKNKKIQQIETREHERRFFIVPEMLEPAGITNFLNIRDDYYVIIPPDTDLRPSDARRAFLQFVVDPLVLTNAKDISTVQAGVKQLLDERRKINPDVTPDVYLAIGRSLVAAIDARELEHSRVSAATLLARRKIDAVNTEAEKKAVSAELDKLKQGFADETALRLSDDYEKGAILAFYFAQQLKGLEDSGFDIASSMREMILSLDASKEANRLNEFAEARKRGIAAREERRRNPEATTVVIENPVTNRLLEIQKTIDAKDFAKAYVDLQELSKTNPAEPRIYYAIGRVAGYQAEAIDDQQAQNKKLIEAKNAYAQVLKTATPTTDQALLSLTYVALAKIYEFYNDTTTAIQLYNRALAYGPLDKSGYAEALAAKQRLVKNQ